MEKNIPNTEFSPNCLYWFAEFDEIECGKRKVNEL